MGPQSKGQFAVGKKGVYFSGREGKAGSAGEQKPHTDAGGNVPVTQKPRGGKWAHSRD